MTDQIIHTTAVIARAARLSVAPMMEWTDRHCRFFHRQMSSRALLYTEMVTSPALVRGGALHLLKYSTVEHPVALQLGGSDPAELAEAARRSTFKLPSLCLMGRTLRPVTSAIRSGPNAQTS